MSCSVRQDVAPRHDAVSPLPTSPVPFQPARTPPAMRQKRNVSAQDAPGLASASALHPVRATVPPSTLIAPAAESQHPSGAVGTQVRSRPVSVASAASAPQQGPVRVRIFLGTRDVPQVRGTTGTYLAIYAHAPDSSGRPSRRPSSLPTSNSTAGNEQSSDAITGRPLTRAATSSNVPASFQGAHGRRDSSILTVGTARTSAHGAAHGPASSSPSSRRAEPAKSSAFLHTLPRNTPVPPDRFSRPLQQHPPRSGHSSAPPVQVRDTPSATGSGETEQRRDSDIEPVLARAGSRKYQSLPASSAPEAAGVAASSAPLPRPRDLPDVRTGDWVRIGRTEIFRGPMPPPVSTLFCVPAGPPCGGEAPPARTSEQPAQAGGVASSALGTDGASRLSNVRGSRKAGRHRRREATSRSQAVATGNCVTLEYATPVILTHYPGRSRTLHICLYAVPRRAGLPHVLVAFGQVRLGDVVDAGGTRIHVPVERPVMPIAIDAGSGASSSPPQQPKLRPSAAMWVCAEPIFRGNSLQMERYTFGVTANFLERTMRMKRTAPVNRILYTLHLDIGGSEGEGEDRVMNETVSGDESAKDSSPEAEGFVDVPGSEDDGGGVASPVSNEDERAAEPSTSRRGRSGGSASSGGRSNRRETNALRREEAKIERQERREQQISSSERQVGRRKGESQSALEEAMSTWALVFRSGIVDRVNCKASGGTMDINYFSNKPLLSIPGITIQDPDERAAEPTALEMLAIKIGMKPDKSQVFSMPNATFMSSTSKQRIRLSVFDARKHMLLASTTFTIEALRKMDLGAMLPFIASEKKETRTVGTACLAQVEHCDDPRYYGFRIDLPDL